MGTVTSLDRRRTPARISPLRPRMIPPERDRALDLRLVPGSVVAHPDSDPWGPACTAMLLRRDDSDGKGEHFWWVLSCPDDPASENDVATFPTMTGARFLHHSPETLRQIREWIDLSVLASAGRHPSGGGAA